MSGPASAGDSSSPEQQDLAVILQPACHLHCYTRSSSDAHIYERPERLRSVRLGIAVAHGRLSTLKGKDKATAPPVSEEKQLENLLDSLNLNRPSEHNIHAGFPFSVITPSKRVPLSLDNPAISLAHGKDYIPRLLSYTANVEAAHLAQQSEVPLDLPQGDLYLCHQGSLEALEGALGACCEAVDQVCSKDARRAKRFVNVRPPGHHCETEMPMGFCWLNNVAVAAAHAYIDHGIDRVLIFDIDLHHGNGTQEIVWRLNALAHKHVLERQELERKLASPKKGSPRKVAPLPEDRPPLRLFYGSLHDVNSYPCEELDPLLVARASVNISGGGGSQYISNVHLEPYEDEDSFHSDLYASYRARLFDPARKFVKDTGALPERTLVFISAGFDASEHEYPAMSRHGAKVPTSFFERFARDAGQFADSCADGKLVAVLEGGYSQSALMTGVGSLLTGMCNNMPDDVDTAGWWKDISVIAAYEALGRTNASPQKGKRTSASKTAGTSDDLRKVEEEEWFRSAKALYARMEEATISALPAPVKASSKPVVNKVVPPATRTTRSATPVTNGHVAPSATALPVPSEVGQHSESASNVPQPAQPPEPALPKNVTIVKEEERVANVSKKPSIRFTFKAGEMARDGKE